MVDQQTLDQRIPHGFGGVVHQVDHDALELFRIDIHGRKVQPEVDAQIDAVQSSGEHIERIADDLIQVAGHRLRGGKARELRKLVSQVLDRFHFAGNGGGAFAQDPLRLGTLTAPRSSWRAIRSAHKRDGRQRIFQFMRDAAGHFVPGGGFLRAQQFAGVFEHHHEPGRGGMAARAARKR